MLFYRLIEQAVSTDPNPYKSMVAGSLINIPLFEIEFFDMIFSLTTPKLIASFYFVILFLSIIILRHFIYLSIKSLFEIVGKALKKRLNRNFQKYSQN